MKVSLPKSLEVKFCDRDEAPSLLRFLDRHCRQGHVFTRDEKLFHWLNFDERENRFNFALVREKGSGEIHAILGANPHRHYDPTLPYMDLALHLGKVRDESRGNAFGRALYAFFVEKLRPRSIYLSGITPRAKKVMEDSLGGVTGTLRHYYLVSSRVRAPRLLRDWDGRHDSASEPDPAKALVACPPSCLDVVFAELDAGYRHAQVPGKSLAYLRRRYLEHPRYRYEILALQERAETKAACVIRSVTAEGARMIKLVDFFGNAAAIRGSRALWQALLARYEAEYLELYQWGWDPELVKSAGFLQRESASPVVVPTYFEPFEARNVDLDFAYWVEAGAPRPFLIFKGDADQDRPNR